MPQPSVSADVAVEVTKHSWRGAYSRLIRLSDSSLITLHPAERRTTNQWQYVDIESARQQDRQVTVHVLGSGSLCGLGQDLRFALPSVEDAVALQLAIQRRLTRQIISDGSARGSNPSVTSRVSTGHRDTVTTGFSQKSLQDSEDNPVSRVSAVRGGSDEEAEDDEEPSSPSGMLSFDVHVTINKARNLPSVSFLWPNAVGMCVLSLHRFSSRPFSY